MRNLLRFFYQHFYHTFSFTYDLVAAIVSIGRWLDWARAALPHLKGQKVLEIGFGPGHLQVEMQKMGLTVFGLDESWQMIRQTRRILGRFQLPAALMRGVAQNLPLASASLDSVLSTFPSEYITDKRTLAGILRALRPGGRLVVVPVAWIFGKSALDKLARWLFQVTGQNAPAESLENRFNTFFTEAGFRVEIRLTEIRRSTVMVIVAEKPESAEPLIRKKVE